MTPADGVKALMQNMLGEAEEEEVVVNTATYINNRMDRDHRRRRGRHDAVEDSRTSPLRRGPGDFEEWMECWSRIEIMDMHLWPLWEKEVHDILQPLFKELQLIFLAYTRSISEDSAADAMEMDMGEFHDFVVDVGLETKDYTFDVMCNQFVKANATNTAQVREQRMEARKNAASKDDLEEQKKAKAKVPEKIKGTNDGQGGQEGRRSSCCTSSSACWCASPSGGATRRLATSATRASSCRCRPRSRRCSTRSSCRTRSARRRACSARRR